MKLPAYAGAISKASVARRKLVSPAGLVEKVCFPSSCPSGISKLATCQFGAIIRNH
jgi:hypothetical protein